jgi:UDPglucose 6-dehydrogenase
MRLVESTIAVNESRKPAMARRIAQALGGDLNGKKIAVQGLTFKPGTDDLRDAPSITIIRSLQDRGATISAYDPKVGEEAQPVFPGVDICPSARAAAKGADGVVLMTEWPEIKSLSPATLAAAMGGRVAIDLRNGWDAAAFAAHGFTVHRVGAAAVSPPQADAVGANLIELKARKGRNKVSRPVALPAMRKA